MANLTRKTSKSKTRSRRAANMKLRQNLNLVECSNCHQKKLPHRVCSNCGFYDGRDVLNIAE
ncbi:MAG: 50S ribosomal protein L32 [Candidatus Goldbacteria bacterium]|nr:50S ribosomal protein L32 [Candidatus Goldiibacteriota bacterium]